MWETLVCSTDTSSTATRLRQSCTDLCFFFFFFFIKGTQWTHNSTYQVPDIAWLKRGGGGVRGEAQGNEGDAYEKRKKESKKGK